MCLLCIEVAKSRMTIPEARRALPEMIATTEVEEDRQHYEELRQATDEQLAQLARQSAGDTTTSDDEDTNV